MIDVLHELPVLKEVEMPASSGAGMAAGVPEDFGLAYDPRRAAAELLTDAFGRQHTYLRIALVEQCNLRCRYCMPEEGLDFAPEAHLLTDDEVVRLARLFVAAGVTKIRLTGGEPLLRQGVVPLVEALGALPGLETLALTTNGLLLPKRLAALRAGGLNALNISLDTLRADRFEAITRRKGFDLVMRAVTAAAAAGYDPVKVNCVVMRGVNDDELPDFVAWTRDLPVEVRFIEFMPFDGNRWHDDRLVPFAEMMARIRAHYTLVRLDDGPHETSKTYAVPGHRGRLGFITSMTEPFCEGCNRLRITADGHLKVCLFGRAEVSLRDAMRAGATDDDLRALVSGAVGRKHARHAGMHTLAERRNRPMILIGG